MMGNAQKANFTIDEVGLQLVPQGNLKDWDGLTGWFLRQAEFRKEIREEAYLRKWASAARRVTLEAQGSR